jgi:manganese efflux pump family protein
VAALVVVALSVGIGNFGAATAIGISGVDRRTRLAVAVVFGVFEGGAPILGILVGHSAANRLGGHASLVGGLVLCAAGLYVLINDLVRRGSKPSPAGTGLPRLVVLAALLSLDNLVVGFALGTDHVSLVSAAIVLGTVSALLGLAGLELGQRVGTRAGKWSEALGGVVLVCVGIAIAAGA